MDESTGVAAMRYRHLWFPSFGLILTGPSALADTIGYKDYANDYVIGFLAICAIIVVAQVLTAFREPKQNTKSTQELVDEMEAKHAQLSDTSSFKK